MERGRGGHGAEETDDRKRKTDENRIITPASPTGNYQDF